MPVEPTPEALRETLDAGEGRAAAVSYTIAWFCTGPALSPGVGQEIPHAAVMWDPRRTGLGLREAERLLRSSTPPIAVQVLDPLDAEYSAGDPQQIRIHPHTPEEGQEVIIARRLLELVQSRARR